MADYSVTSGEGQGLDYKSLRKVTGASADYSGLAQDCVCFANGSGGQLMIGIEDGETEPPAEQRVNPGLLDQIRKRIGELTVNVSVLAELRCADNGGEYLALTVARSVGVASTTDGRFFLRVGDTCRPVVGDDILRLADERPAIPWETMTALGVPRSRCENTKRLRLTSALRASDRVKPSVKEKTDNELLDHYGLASGDVLTNLGVLLVGVTTDRARLGRRRLSKRSSTMSAVTRWPSTFGTTTACRPSSLSTQSGERSPTFARHTSFPTVCSAVTFQPTKKRSSVSWWSMPSCTVPTPNGATSSSTSTLTDWRS